MLCAGSIGSTQILQLSASGRRNCAQDGIPVVADLPGVGENLQDHLQIRAVFKVDGVATLNTLASSWWGKLKIGMEYALKRSGPMSMAPSQLGAFTRSGPDQPYPNIEYHVQPLSLDAFGEPLHGFNAFTASVCNLNSHPPRSVRIRSNRLRTPRRSPPTNEHAEDRKVAAIRAGHAAHRAAAGAGEVQAAGMAARPPVPERRGPGAAGRRHRDHHLPPWARR